MSERFPDSARIRHVINGLSDMVMEYEKSILVCYFYENGKIHLSKHTLEISFFRTSRQLILFLHCILTELYLLKVMLKMLKTLLNGELWLNFAMKF